MENGKEYRVPCMIMRGGTSKGIFFKEEDLPTDANERDQVLLRIMGSPDLKQIDGLGGASSVTSKVAIVSVSQREDADVDYTFAQVSVDKPIVSYKGNCGNISSAVGPFAIEQGMVKLEEPVTKVRIYNTNTDKIIEAEVETAGGSVKYHGSYAIAGVKGTASPIKLKFIKPSGTLSGQLLPTGSPVDKLEVPMVGEVEVSIIDAANPLVFVRAKDIGLKGTELPEEIDSNPEMLQKLEFIRGAAAKKIGLIEDISKSAWETPGIPKLTIVECPKEYHNVEGRLIGQGEIDLLARMMSMQKAHPTYAMTGAMCTAAAAVVKGSVVWNVLRQDTNTQNLRIGHPGGILEAGVDYTENAGEVIIDDTFGFRTANLLLEGSACCTI